MQVLEIKVQSNFPTYSLPRPNLCAAWSLAVVEDSPLVRIYCALIPDIVRQLYEQHWELWSEFLVQKASLALLVNTTRSLSLERPVQFDCYPDCFSICLENRVRLVNHRPEGTFKLDFPHSQLSPAQPQALSWLLDTLESFIPSKQRVEA